VGCKKDCAAIGKDAAQATRVYTSKLDVGSQPRISFEHRWTARLIGAPVLRHASEKATAGLEKNLHQSISGRNVT
jgi:hypothetical protein